MAMGLSHAFETRYRKRSLQPVQFMRTKASGYPSWPGVTDSTQGRIHWRRPTAILVFRLQLCGGPYMTIIPVSRDLARSRRTLADITTLWPSGRRVDFNYSALAINKIQRGSFVLPCLPVPRLPLNRGLSVS